MPDQADPRPRPAAPARGTAFKPIALPALKGVLLTKQACETKAAAKPTLPEDLDRFGRAFTA
ncbi:hypothetical protein ACTZWW_12560 [Salinarimonas sp. NSM]|uniref:hypothetical protein n=1 Tax=Salinarimonas sp. NSM TaxID=3458003 RepID=UPI004036CBC1